MTSEVEVPSFPRESYGSSKFAALLALDHAYHGKESGDPLKEQISSLIFTQTFFHENFYMFPLSKKRMVVVINPFFKLFKHNMDEGAFPEILLSNFSNMPRWDVFDVNESQYLMTDDNERSMKDWYIYHPVKLWHEELVYCNALFLDRVHEWVGFTSLESVKDSVVEYDTEEYVRNDYTELHKLVSGLPSSKSK